MAIADFQRGAARLARMGHNSWIANAERIETTRRAETSRELIVDAVALVEKWNADLEARKEAQYGYAERAA